MSVGYSPNQRFKLTRHVGLTVVRMNETMVKASDEQLRSLLDGGRRVLRLHETFDAPDSTPISECHVGDVVTLAGTVISVQEKHQFTREDGTEGFVRNITIQDMTGVVEVALWDDDAQRDITSGDVVQVFDGEVQEAYEGDGIQVNVGYDNRIRIFDGDENVECITLMVDGDSE